MKGISLLMSIVAVLSAVICGWLYTRVQFNKDELIRERDSIRTQLTAAQQRTAEIETERDALAVQLGALQRDSSELKARNTTLEARNSQLSREVTQHRTTLSNREQADFALQQDLATLRKQLAESRASIASAVTSVASEQVAAYEARIADLETQLAALRRGDVPPAMLAAVPADLRGEVIDVGPKSAFVVLNIGSRQGAVSSLEMVLRRGSTVVARIRLTDVHETYSIGHVLPESGTGNIRSGDVASRS